MVGGVNVALGLLLGFGLPAAVPELPLAGSLLFGASIAAVGLVFAAAAAFTSQLTEHARGATGLASALLGVAFALRAAGDLGEGTLSWLSPLGWAQRTRAYVDGRWWPLLLALGLTVLLGAAAFVLGARRDVGAGLMPARRGRAAASGALVRPLGLALRLQRGILTGWGVGLLLFGVFIGSLAEEAGDFLAGNETARQFLARFGGMDNLTDSVLATYMFMLALVATGYAVQAAMVLRGEETAGRVEPLLGTPLARTRWAGSHLAVAVLGSTVIVGGAGLGAGVMYAASTGDWGQLPRVLAAAVAHLPALWVFVGLAAALFGLAPRAVGLTWVGLVGAVFVGILGPLLQLPDWVYDLSPFGHTPQLPAADFTPGPLAALTAIAAGLMAVGLVAFRRRDAG